MHTTQLHVCTPTLHTYVQLHDPIYTLIHNNMLKLQKTSHTITALVTQVQSHYYRVTSYTHINPTSAMIQLQSSCIQLHQTYTE